MMRMNNASSGVCQVPVTIRDKGRPVQSSWQIEKAIERARLSPQFVLGGGLGGTDELVGSSAQEISSSRVSQSPPAGRRGWHDDLEAGAIVLFVSIARHIAKLKIVIMMMINIC